MVHESVADIGHGDVPLFTPGGIPAALPALLRCALFSAGCFAPLASGAVSPLARLAPSAPVLLHLFPCLALACKMF